MSGGGALAYYNEHDPFAAEWLISLIDGGHIAPGYVDTRDIQDVRREDLEGFTQHHFFAGIGGWSLALRLAGWPDDRPVWTGSCPCQPFSAAGKGEGVTDPRHLWPEWFRLIREYRPGVVFGEQVEAAVRHGWLDAVSADVEAEGYRIGACVLGAHSVGAPHIRQRVFFVADAAESRSARGEVGGCDSGDARERPRWRVEPQRNGAARGLADLSSGRRGEQRREVEPGDVRHLDGGGGIGRVADTDGAEPDGRKLRLHADGGSGDGAARIAERSEADHMGDTVRGRQQEPPQRDGDPQPHPADRHPSGANVDRSNPWASVTWLPCRDGKARPAQPGIFPLAHGVPNRVGTLRGAGNAIVPEVAAEFIAAWCEVKAGLE